MVSWPLLQVDSSKPLGFGEGSRRKSSQSFSVCLVHKTSPRFDLGLNRVLSDVAPNREGAEVVCVTRDRWVL